MVTRRNNLNIGIGIGILLPMVVFGILLGVSNVVNVPFRTRTLAVLSVCVNVFLMRQFKKTRAAESVRGVVLATVGLAIIWFIYFYQEIFAEF